MIPKLNNILNYIPNNFTLMEVKMKMGNTSNFALISLVGPSGDNDIWLHLASANLLMKILSGIQTFDTLPNFVPPSKADFWEKNTIIMYSLREIIGIFQSTISSLSIINMEKANCIEWANIVFHHQRHIDHFVNNLDLRSSIEALKGSEEKIYFGAYVRAHSMSLIFLSMNKHFCRNLKTLIKLFIPFFVFILAFSATKWSEKQC